MGFSLPLRISKMKRKHLVLTSDGDGEVSRDGVGPSRGSDGVVACLASRDLEAGRGAGVCGGLYE